MDKDLIDETRRMIERVLDMLSEIHEYLGDLRKRAEVETAAMRAVSPQLTEQDPRHPYLAGRQPRRNGDVYGSVPPPAAAGGTLDHDPAGTLRPTGKR